MKEDNYHITKLAEFSWKLLRSKNTNLSCNLRHGFWSLSGLAALSACGGGGGGGGGGGASSSSSNSQPSQPPSFNGAVMNTVENSPNPSGLLLNFDSSQQVLGGFPVEPRSAHAYESGALLTAAGSPSSAGNPPLTVPLAGNDYSGTNANDYFYGSGSANSFTGRGGNDELIGRGGNDILWGGAGTDTLLGGAGNDIIIIIGSNGVSFNYQSADLTIAADDLASRGTALNLITELGMTLADIRTAQGNSEYVAGETIDGGGGTNDLVIFGNVDVSSASVSNVNLANFGNFVISSNLTLSAVQLSDLSGATIIGRDMRSELIISGSGAADFTPIRDVMGTLMIEVQNGVTLGVDNSQIAMLKQAGDSVMFTGAGGLNFSGEVMAGELGGIIATDANLTITEAGNALDGDEGSVGSVSIDQLQGLRVGNELRANNPVDEDGVTGALQYQWLRGGTAIVSAINASYTLVTADAAEAISVRVTYTDAFGEQTATSAEIQTDNTPGSISIDQSQGLQVGNELRAENLMDVDGIKVIPEYEYQWLRDGTAIVDAIYASYTLVTADANKAISVEVTYMDAFGEQTATSTAVQTLDTPGTVSITASQGATVGSDLMAQLEDVDGIKERSAMYQWVRIMEESEVIVSSIASYSLQMDDVGMTIELRVTYRDAFDSQLVTSSVGPVVIVDTVGSLSIDQKGSNVGDVFLGRLEDPDMPTAVEYRWYRGETGGTEIGQTATYRLAAADAGETLRLEVSYFDIASGEQKRMLASMVQIASPIPTTEPVADGADDDLRQLAKLGSFTGDSPADEAKPIQLEDDQITISPGHANGVNAVFESEALLDSAVELTVFDIRDFAEAKTEIDALDLPNNNHMIFTLAHSEPIRYLDELFTTYDNSIIFISAGNDDEMNPFLVATRSTVQSSYEKWAAEGRLYFVGGHADNNETELHDNSAHAGITKDYYFLSPYNYPAFGGTSSAVQQVGAKVEAAFNVLNQTYGIDMVETVRILRGTASSFADPDDDIGLGVINLEMLLTEDENGNVSLKSLAELRTQAGLNPDTGLPVPPPESTEPQKPPDFHFGTSDSADEPNDKPADDYDNDFAGSDSFLPANQYDDFI